MSMKTYANDGYAIPTSILEKEFPEEIAFIQENEDEFVEWLDSYGNDNDELAIKFGEIGKKVKDWGTSKGLELGFGTTYMDEDNEDEEKWLCFCENAITINPAFEDLGGKHYQWTTFG